MAPATTPAPRARSIRSRMQWLVAASLVPAWLVVAGMTLRAYLNDREHQVASTVATARALARLVDAELQRNVAVLQTLAASPQIDADDMASFRAQATQALRHGGGDNIVLFGRELQGRMSVAHPPGTPLPRQVHDRFPAVMAEGTPAVSDIFIGQVSKRPQVAVAVPVLREGRAIGRLEMVFTPQNFQALLVQQALPAGWITGITDRAGQLVARHPDAASFVGKPAAEVLRRALAASSEGHFEGRTGDGIDTIGCFSRSPASGWSVAIGIPRVELQRELVRRLGLVAGGGLLLLVASLVLAGRLARSVAAPVQALVAPALAIGRGESAQVPSTTLKEANTVGAALGQAAALLAERDRARLAAETALRDSESRLRLALDAAEIGTWDLDLRTLQLQRNERHDLCYGLPPLQPWSRERFYAIVHPDDLARVKADWDTRFAAGPGAWQMDYRVVWSDASVHWLSLRGITITDDAGVPVRMLGILMDLSDRHQAEELRLQRVQLEAENRQILEANRLKSEFLANMSHELRTPLNAVIGFADILRSPLLPPDSPKRGEYLGHIAAGGQHLLQLINDVLDLAKVESGRFEFFAEPLQLSRVVQEVVGVLQAEAARKRIRLALELDPEVDEARLDPARLKQVLYNFLSNAIKFTAPGGRVVVRSRAEGPDQLRLEVEDNGIGIAEADQRRLFTPFQQVSAGSTKQHGGTGLGLALTRRLAELQGGRVGLSSTPGEGSVFHVVLPRRAGPAGRPAGAASPTGLRAAVAAAPAPAEGVAAGSARVLVIEDEVADQRRLVQALSAAGFEVDVAGTAEQALQQAAGRRYDAITLDLLLPAGSGLAVLAQLRTDPATAQVPVIVVTMVTETSALAGFPVSDVLHKPIHPPELLAALRRAGLHGRGSAPVVLVADDEAGARELMAATLAAAGMTAICVADGAAALASLDRQPPDALILDLAMPGLNGFDVLQALRERPALARLPVFVWTAMTLSADEWAALSRSARAIAAKTPAGVEALVEQIRHWHGSDAPPAAAAAAAAGPLPAAPTAAQALDKGE